MPDTESTIGIKVIETAKRGSGREAQLEQAGAPGTVNPNIRCADYHLPGEKEMNADYFLREPEVLRRFPVSRSQLWAMVKRGEFPAPVKLSERCSAWANSSLNQHANRLKAGGTR